MFNLYIKILAVILMPLSLFAQTEKFTEYEVKAAFLEKFTRFIDWPAESQIYDINKPFIIGVIGKSPFNSILEKTFSKQKIKGKKVEIRYFSTVNDIDSCNLLFISKVEGDQINQIFSYIKKKPIVTVSDCVEYLKKGVIITLFIENGRVLFQINQNAVQESGLYFSSLLLNLSKVPNAKEND